MTATATHCAIPIPDWNSLDSVRRAHSVLEASALIFFALLVLFDVLSHLAKDETRKRLLDKIALCFFAVAVLAEIAAYPYGQRNDFLSDQIIISLDHKSKDADQRLTTIETKAGDINTRLDRASSQLTEIEVGVAWRHLTSTQKMETARRLRESHSPSKVTVWFFSGDAEGLSFAADIVEMLREARIQSFPPRELGPLAGQSASISDPISRSETGVKVASTNDAPSLSLADAITRELKSCGFDADVIKSDGPTSLAKDIGPNVVVVVLARPIGPQGEAKLGAAKKKHSSR